MSDDPLIGTRDLAAHLDVSDRTVRGLVERGIIHAAAPGQYRRDAARVGYIRHLREQAAGRAAGATAERERLLRAQAERLERANRVAAGEVIPVREVETAWTQVVAEIRAHVLSPADRAWRR